MARNSTVSIEFVTQAQSTSYRFACSTCPYVHNITKRISNRFSPSVVGFLWTNKSTLCCWLNVQKKDVGQNPVYNHMLCRSYTKLKEVDDVLGGAAAWENVDSCDEKVKMYTFVKTLGLLYYVWLVTKPFSSQCPKCENLRAYFMQIQTRLVVTIIRYLASNIIMSYCQGLLMSLWPHSTSAPTKSVATAGGNS